MNNIQEVSGNLLNANVEALVNTVNTVGVMGKGIALQFRQAFPDNYEQYRLAAKHGEIQPGKMFTTPTTGLDETRYIINFPTKRDWRSKARLEDIESGLVDLVRIVPDLEIKSLAVPPLGCGNGGLRWDVVRPLIIDAMSCLPDTVNVLLYSPEGAPDADTMRVATTRPQMTPTRAALMGLLERYEIPGYRITVLEIQKLVYFLQVAGQPMKLNFEKNQFGPYTETLQHVLQRMEGHFLRGYGDRSKAASIHLLPDAVREADLYLEEHPETMKRLKIVADLIDGFETPYGLELLATIHWLAVHDEAVRNDKSAAVAGVHAWSKRKAERFQQHHIEIAWHQLKDKGWI